MDMGVCELLWLKIIIDDLKMIRDRPKLLYCDGKSIITIVQNPIQCDHTNHIEVHRHFIKEKLETRLFFTTFLSTQDPVSDDLTKGPNNKYQDLTNDLGMEDTHSPP